MFDVATNFRSRLTIALMACLLMVSMHAQAVITIEVKEGKVTKIPIAVVPFSMIGVSPNMDQPADVIENDLSTTGRFDLIPRESFLSSPHDLVSVKYKDWRLIKTEALIVGKVIQLGNGQHEVRFRLIDIYREKQLAGRKFVVPENKLRKVSHQISDEIYKLLTGEIGAFDTKIAYVMLDGKTPNLRYHLKIADSDGHGAMTVLESPQPILSPAWSPEGNRLAYVSFEKRRSMIFIQDIASAKRDRIADYEGINSAPAWSPDGRQLAVTLSKDGNPDIYIYDLRTAKLTRLTRNHAIDTEPTWSPDGKMIVFTSGRSGNPQIYRIPVRGGKPQRLTHDGEYNAGPSYSPDGRSIALITNQGNGFKVGLYSLDDKSVRELTDSRQDESPTFAPNGETIMYATKVGGRNLLATISVDGQVQQNLRYQEGSIREPAWSPFNRNP